MPYIPEDAEEITVEDAAENVVHINVILIHAHSPEEAYSKAQAHGEENAMTYLNPQGKTVTAYFRGLRDIFVIYEDLTDGAEIMYEEYVGMPEEELRETVKPRDRLSIFSDPVTPANRPDYASKEVVDDLQAFFEQRDEGKTKV
jgi:hypothetical protein